MINYKVIAFILGILWMIEGFFMLISVPITLIFGDSDAIPLLTSSGTVISIGLLTWYSFRKSEMKIAKREGYLIVTLGWLTFSLFGTLPFFISGAIPSFTDAFFETISGFTTTGASILNDIESKTHGILFWRSIIQWLGGMGIIVLSLLILPALGIGGMQLFVAEVPGPTPDKLHPRVKETAKRLWFIYCAFTLAETLLLWVGEMDLFDALCHSFTTMATGGYSTKQASIAHFVSPFTHYVIILFMIIAGINFTLSYFAFHLDFKQVLKDEEFRFYISFIILFTLIIAPLLFFSNTISMEQSFRDSLFQVVSILTTTGYVTADYMQWVPLALVSIFILMFFGGSAGSTGGSVKIIRVVLLLKNSFAEFKRLIHPNALIPVRLNKQAVQQEVVTNVLAFASIYILMLILSTIIIASLGYDLESSLGAVASCLGNIGPGLGAVGPAENYAHFPIFGKWFLSFLMLIGRLELFTVLVLFTPYFWKK